MINLESTGDIPQTNDFSNIRNYTDMLIPTILHGEIAQDMVIRGLCGITLPEAHVVSNKTFTFDGIVEFNDKEDVSSSLYLDLGSFSVINDLASISIPSDYIIINGNLNFGDYVNYKSDRCNLVLNQKNDETIYCLTFENISPNDYIAALDIQTTNYLYIRASFFSMGTKTIGKPTNVSIDSSFFIKSIISFSDPLPRSNKVVIDSCVFYGIHHPYDNFSTIYLNGIERFLISNSGISQCGRNGITLNFCGLAISPFNPGLIINDTIYDNINTHESCVGISVRSSFCEIRNNKILRNNFGINSYGNSKVLLEGNANAIYTDETQEIWGNTRKHVISGDEASVPYVFKWNYVAVENDLEPEVVLTTPSNCKIHSIEYNYWGNDFSNQNIEKYFFPYKCFDWEPGWSLIPTNVGQVEDELIYNDALTHIEQQNYIDSKEIFFSLINLFPESKFSETAMKDLMLIENEISPNFQSIIEYFEYDTAIIKNKNLQKLGKSLINNCLILDGDYESALINYLSALTDSLSYNDSIIILSNIEYVNYLIENLQGYKSSQNAEYYNYMAELDCDFQKSSNYFEELLLNPYSVTIQEQLNKLKNEKLLQNFPNPFNQNTTIFFKLEESSLANIKLFDYTGKKIRLVHLGFLEKGNHKVEIDGKELKSGSYFYSLELNGLITDTKKMTIIN